MENSVLIKKGIHLADRTKQIMINAIAYIFLFIFIYSAYENATKHSAFVESLERYTFIKEYAYWISWLIISAEVTVSFLLLFPTTRKLGLYGAFIIMLLFTIGLLIIVFTMAAQYCSCSGFLKSLSAREHIWFNAVFIVLAIMGIRLAALSSRAPAKEL